MDQCFGVGGVICFTVSSNGRAAKEAGCAFAAANKQPHKMVVTKFRDDSSYKNHKACTLSGTMNMLKKSLQMSQTHHVTFIFYIRPRRHRGKRKSWSASQFSCCGGRQDQANTLSAIRQGKLNKMWIGVSVREEWWKKKMIHEELRTDGQTNKEWV